MTNLARLGADLGLNLWKQMLLIRCFEERVARSYADGKIPGFIHLSIGQEAIAAGVCAALTNEDVIYVSHRGHGQCLAKGADPQLMMAELYGKENGYCRGRGGSMHIAAVEKGVLGANGIVGGSFALAAGAAYALQLSSRRGVVVVFFGDGAVNEGLFHETLNIAALWQLPLLFVCENNGYAQFTPLAAEHAQPEIYKHGRPYGIEGVRVDGNDVAAVYDAAQTAVEHLRQGDGPALLECLTYRWRGHYEGDPERYREAAEVKAWQDETRDPIARAAAALTEASFLSDAEAVAYEEQFNTLLDEAVAFAESSPDPDPEAAIVEVYI